MITGTIPPKIEIPAPTYGRRFEHRARVINGEPYLEDSQFDQYVWVPPGFRYYYNTETQEIVEREEV